MVTTFIILTRVFHAIYVNRWMLRSYVITFMFSMLLSIYIIAFEKHDWQELETLTASALDGEPHMYIVL